LTHVEDRSHSLAFDDALTASLVLAGPSGMRAAANENDATIMPVASDS
jgi:hypothetical protein